MIDVAAGRFGSYHRLFAVPGSRRLAVADLCARLPQGMLSIGTRSRRETGAASPAAGRGPTLATLFSTAASAAPEGSGTEAQSWLNSMMNGGAAAGAALAGLVASQPVLGLALATGAAAAAALTAAVIRPAHRVGTKHAGAHQ